MSGLFFQRPAPRFAQTTIPCARCGEPLAAKRTCSQAYLHCPACRKDFDVREYAKKMDRTLEDFLEALHCDRV